MPIIGYKCKACEMEFEVLYTSFNKQTEEEPNEECPKCSSKDKEKALPSKTNFQLKGGGWARHGYRGGSRGK